MANKTYKLEFVMELDDSKQDDFMDRLISIVEDLGGDIGGALAEYKEDNNEDDSNVQKGITSE